jgi:hypothetical protein
MLRRDFIKAFGMGSAAVFFFTSEAFAVEIDNSSKIGYSSQPPRMLYGNNKSGCTGCVDYGIPSDLM